MRLADLTDKAIPENLLDRNGTLEGWQDAANMLFAAGCEPQAFALLASLGAPLMSLLPHDEGGSVVSIYGGRKAGKRVVYGACQSAWGLFADMPIEELPFAMARLANRDPSSARKAITHFSGAGRKSILISTTGEPLLPKLFDDDCMPGIEFEVRVPRSLIAPKDGDRIYDRLMFNRGNAGMAMLQYITRGNVRLWATKMMISAYAQTKDDTGLGEEHRFPLRAIAVVTVGAMIAAELRLLDFDPQRIPQWAIGQMKERRAAA